MSGAAAFKSHPRIMAEPVIENMAGGLKAGEVAKLFKVPLNDVLSVYEFYRSRNPDAPLAS